MSMGVMYLVGYLERSMRGVWALLPATAIGEGGGRPTLQSGSSSG